MLVASPRGQNHTDVPKDYDKVIMGIKPSAPELHMGHWVTARKFLDLLELQPESEGLVIVDDRQWDMSNDSKYDVQNKERNTPKIISRMKQFFRSFADAGFTDFEKRVRLLAMSEYMQQLGNDSVPNGSILFDIVQASRDTISKIYPDYIRPTDIDGILRIVRPICCQCDTLALRKSHTRMGIGNLMYSTCQNRQCPTNDYCVNPTTAIDSNRWGLHYVFAAMRDVRVARDTNSGIVHVYGADYFTAKQSVKPTNAERMHDLLTKLLPCSPVHIYVGPLVVDRTNNKLSKSSGDSSLVPNPEYLDSLISQSNDVIRMPGRTRNSKKRRRSVGYPYEQ